MRAKHVCSWLALAAIAAVAVAQSAAPANFTGQYSSSNTSTNRPVIAINPGDGQIVKFDLAPLTAEAEDVLLPNAPDGDFGIDGYFILATPTTVGTISSQYIALTSCDSSDYSGGISSLEHVISAELSSQVSAIVFYSLTAYSCNITGDYSGYPWLYSLIGTGNAMDIYQFTPHSLVESTQLSNATIMTYESYLTYVEQNQQAGLSTPSIALGMVVLYAIIGLVVITFLCIFISGAIKAWRHPERYSLDVPGNSYQSRAKGLARAILDTIPIVKFGDGAAAKQEDVELSSAQTSRPFQEPGPDRTGFATRLSGEIARHSHGESSVPLRTGQPAAMFNGTTDIDSNARLGCSICTEDFNRGEDIRVLPCDHRFHPGCIDPWLLDMSATCPLCRVDLRPPRSDSDAVSIPSGIPLAAPSGGAGHGRGGGGFTRRFFDGPRQRTMQESPHNYSLFRVNTETRRPDTAQPPPVRRVNEARQETAAAAGNAASPIHTEQTTGAQNASGGLRGFFGRSVRTSR